MTVHVLGAPSSAGAYSPGQERAPTALREAGLLAALGSDVTDHGDVDGFRWRPDRDSPRAQHVETVARIARAVAGRVEQIVSDGGRALVLGGDCTVGVGTVAGLRAAHGNAPGLVYIDMHPDLNIPTSTTDGALDWMGMAHMLAVDGCCPPLRDVAATTPLLAPGDVVLLGYDEGPATAHEQATIAQLELRTVPMAALIADPRAAAAMALDALPRHDALAVHFDVDVVNFLDAPLSENIERARGATLAGALAALTVVLGDPRVAALTVTELNPDHDDGTAVPRLRDGLARALSAGR